MPEKPQAPTSADMPQPPVPAAAPPLAAPGPDHTADPGLNLRRAVTTTALSGSVWGLLWSLQRISDADAPAQHWASAVARLLVQDAVITAVAGVLGAAGALAGAGLDRALRPFPMVRRPSASALVSALPAGVLAVVAMELAARLVPVRSETEEALRLVVPVWAVAAMVYARGTRLRR